MPSPSSSAKKRPAKKRPSSKAKSIVPAAKSTIPVAEREPRGARRKRETRQRLLEAALRLMAKKGMEGVVINEITEAADVGFGSFYNHFESKEAIYSAVVDWVFEDFADALDRLVSTIADPAEVVSVSVRHTLLRAQREPVWGQFLIREGFSARVLERGLGQRLLRDIKKGIASGRFKREDALMSFLSVGGTVLASISVWLQFHEAHGARAAAIHQLGFNVDDLSQRVAKTLLLTLGLTRLEAEKIAYRPLPGDGMLPDTSTGSAAAAAG
ncbi:TetR/AcrR family transcriptional regulator [Lysobacter terrae]